MQLRFSQHRFISAFAAITLVSALCGESPLQGRVPHAERPMSSQAQSRPQSESRPASSPQRPLRTGASAFVPARVNFVARYPGTHTVVPPGWVRCTRMPDMGYWHSRDLMAEIQWLSRSGFIPVSPVGDSVEVLSDYAMLPAGWRAYGISVPAGGTMQVEVQHTKLGWFRLMLMNKWGVPGPGMLQASIAPQPVMVTYKNPNKEATAVYVIVDDPAWWSDAKNPYTLHVRRDWDPAKTDLSQVKMVAGLWGASPSVSAEFHGPSLTGPAVFPR